MVIDQGYFHIVDNDLTFTITWKLLILWVSAKSHLDQLQTLKVATGFQTVHILKARKISEKESPFQEYIISKN